MEEVLVDLNVDMNFEKTRREEEEDVVDVDISKLAEDLYNIRMLEESLVRNSKYLEVVSIDSSILQDSCSSCYATSIYENNRVAELDQRPSSSYMEQVQRDIDPSMRAFLIDWLVEIEWAYKDMLVENEYCDSSIASDDILHLTVNLIDRYLSHNYVEKSRLELLCATCMLIACKYNDEISCPLRVENFVDFKKQEVLSMEMQVLNLLCFQLSVPTTKTFLEQFIQVAQASDIDKAHPYTDMEHLANYLAELTLLEYSFLKFPPSLIAASAVFLARWTLDQSNHPWNQTLENYTRYEMSALKSTVLAMEELQLNSSGSKLMVIRKKYNQEKYKRVAILKSPERVTTIFSSDEATYTTCQQEHVSGCDQS